MTSVSLITSFNSSYESIASISIPSMRRFAERHNYSFEVIRRDNCSRDAGWIKIEPILDALDGNSDFILWLDADAIPVRTDVDIRSVAIAGKADLFMSWHTPAAGTTGDPNHYNTGVMLIRSSDWSRRFFRDVWKIGPLPHKWNDQAAIHCALGYEGLLELGSDHPDEPNRQHVRKLETEWNSIPVVCAVEDPIIRHYAGMSLESRMEAMVRDHSRINHDG